MGKTTWREERLGRPVFEARILSEITVMKRGTRLLSSTKESTCFGRELRSWWYQFGRQDTGWQTNDDLGFKAY